ncbi:hypothetical protein ACWD4T_22590, partial [Streptomyces umbrinus]
MSQAQDHEHAGPAVPQTRTARHRRIVDILNRQPVRSQSQLACRRGGHASRLPRRVRPQGRYVRCARR